MLPAALRSATWLALFQEIDCGFRNLASSWACYLVFKDRVACASRDFLLPFSSLPPPSFRPAGRQLLFQSGVFCQAAVSRRPAGFRSLQRRPVASAAFFRRGAASTASPPSLSTAASLTPSTRLPSCFRASSSGARLLPPPRSLSTRCVDCRIPYFLTDPLKADPRQCAGFFVRAGASTTTAPGINFLG